MKSIHTLVISAVLLAWSGVHAQQAPKEGDHAAHHATTTATAVDDAPESEGEVRKVDLARGKVTLRHGPLANLDMPAMTMVFNASDPRLLEGLKVGDKVRFTADRKDGVFFVTAIRAER